MKIRKKISYFLFFILMPEPELKDYISLQEATKHCSYSQEYLSLRARQGKLQAVKLGRNWVTTKEWVEEYAVKTGNGTNSAVSDIQNDKNPGLQKETVGVQGLSPEKIAQVVFQKEIPPPENLPSAEFTFSPSYDELPKQPAIKASDIRFGLVFSLVFVLLFAGTVFGKEGLKNTYKDIKPIVAAASEKVNGATDNIIKGGVLAAEKTIVEINDATNLGISDLVSGPKNIYNGIARVGKFFTLSIGESAKELRDEIITTSNDFVSLLTNTFEVSKYTASVFQEFAKWFATNTKYETASFTQSFFETAKTYADSLKQGFKTTKEIVSNALYFLGLTYDKLGRTSKAIENFTKVLQLNPDNQELKTILQNLEAGKPALEGISQEVPPQAPIEETKKSK